MLFFAIIGGLACAIGGGAIANAKGRSGVGYFMLGLFLPFIGLIIAIGMPAIRVAGPDRGAAKRCPVCYKHYPSDFEKCLHCGSVPPPVISDQKNARCAPR